MQRSVLTSSVPYAQVPTNRAQERYASLMSRAKDDDAALDTMPLGLRCTRATCECTPNVERVTKYREGLVKAKVGVTYHDAHRHTRLAHARGILVSTQ